MKTLTLSKSALAMIDAYLHFRLGRAVTSVPYFNNKTVKARAAFRARIGKGSPEEIRDEIQSVVVKDHITVDALADESLKKILVDNNLGIECSGFAYYVLNAESESRGAGKLSKHIHFVNCTGMIDKLRCAMRPVENGDVSTLSADANSSAVLLVDAKPGDIITMTGDPQEGERDHILVVHQVDRDDTLRPTRLHYSHAVAYPEDGVYGSGIRQGSIEISATDQSIMTGLWKESGTAAGAERIFKRAQKSKTELRRLTWF